MLETGRARLALGSLIAMRILYALNWLNIGAIFFAMGPDLGAGVVGLGTLTSTFYLGVVLLQVPGGVMAAQWGPKKPVVLGTILSSIGALATGLAPSLAVVAVLRFFVGAGMAFVFAPAIVIISRLIKSGGSGIGIGLFNSAYDVGGIVALGAWGVIALETGWRLSVEFGGALGVVSGALLAFTIPRDEKNLEFRVKASQLGRVLADKRLVIIAVGMLGVSVGNGLISSFLEYYLIRSFGLGAGAAGSIAAMVVAVPIFAALYGGRLYDQMRRPRLLLLLSNLGGIIALVVCAFPSVLTALACSLLGGFISGIGYTVGFAAAKDFHTAEKEYDGLAVAWVNAISLLGAVFPPLVFSYVADSSGYPYAWLVGAAMIVVFAIPLLFLNEKRAG